jgi:uncharacterized protein YcaQ
MSRTELSSAEARRVALGAQGFADQPLMRPVDARAIRSRVIARLGLLQIDSVNVLERAHYLPVFSRLGRYEHGVLDRMAHRSPRSLFEYWGHEASLIDVRLQPALRWRMHRAHRESWGGMRRVAQERPDLVAAILDEVRERGPLRAADLAHHEGRAHVRGDWWSWSDVKRALEYLFWAGEVTSARRVRFERRYAVPEQVLPQAVLDAPTPPEDEAQRILLRKAAAALGVATAADMRDYFRLSASDTNARVRELVEEGSITPVAVEGWRQQAYLAAGARVPRSVEAAALLVPFDPLIWNRTRVERLFSFRYRVEIYVPEPKRQYGYYVLPFLLGDRLVARVDLKADRAASALLVRGAYAEAHAPTDTADQMALQLASLAGWLGLERVVVERRGDLWAAVAAAKQGT